MNKWMTIDKVGELRALKPKRHGASGAHPVTATSSPGVAEILPNAWTAHDTIPVDMQASNPHQEPRVLLRPRTRRPRGPRRNTR